MDNIAISKREIYSTLLTAFCRPGSCANLAGFLDGQAAHLGVVTSLADRDVAVSNPDGLLGRIGRQLLGAQLTTPDRARVILCAGEYTPCCYRILAEREEPVHGAIVVAHGHHVGFGDTDLTIVAPDESEHQGLAVSGFTADWFDRHNEWLAASPNGIDLVLTDIHRVAVIPRGHRVVVH